MLLRLSLLLLTCAAAAASDDVATSFESFDVGEFTRLAGTGFTMNARAGHAEINAEHTHRGERSLRILGGEARSVTLELPGGFRDAHVLSFHAERWTSRAPFDVKIETRTGRRAWREVRIYDEILVGGYHTRVRALLDGIDLDAIRITCTSPAGSGLLIDDLRIARVREMAVESVTIDQLTRPLLIGKPRIPLLRIRVDVSGNANYMRLSEVTFELRGVEHLDQLELYHTRGYETFDPNAREGQNVILVSRRSPPEADGAFTFNTHWSLGEDENYLWLTARAARDADLTARVDAACRAVVLEGEAWRPADGDPPGSSRIGVPVRDAGQDGVHTYRIPGLATTNAGTLIAVYDQRHSAGRDLPGDVDVGMSRSTDKGRTWEPMRTIMDMGEPHASNGIGDPAVLVDRATGTIWVAATWSHGNRAWNGSGPGLAPEETGQLMLVRSDDDGETWSDPINITRQVKDPAWNYLLQGPGKGICLADGRLVFPAQYRDGDGLPHSTLIHSDDHGATWTIGTGARPNTTESQVVQLADGSLMLNMRDNRGGSRAVMTTSDLGRTWVDHPSTRSLLPEPVCMASLIRFPRPGGDLLLFSNPSVPAPPRRDITMQASRDEGRSWPARLLLHPPASAGYSCMTVVDEEHVGILYEGGSSAHLVFELVPIAELLR